MNYKNIRRNFMLDRETEKILNEAVKIERKHGNKRVTRSMLIIEAVKRTYKSKRDQIVDKIKHHDEQRRYHREQLKIFDEVEK